LSLLALRILVIICVVFNLVLLVYAGLVIFLGSRIKRQVDEKVFLTPPTLSVLIAARREGHILPYTLKILLSRLEYPKDRIEVVVAVDEDDQETLRACEGFDPVRPVVVPNPLGKPKALNVGLKATKGELIMLMDADSVIERGAALKMLSFMDEPSIAGVAAIPYPLNISEGLLPLLFAAEVNLWERLTLAKDALGLFVQAPGSLSLLRRSWVEKLGGWCEKCIAEDNELSARIFCNGGRIRLSTVRVGVEAPVKLSTLIRQRFRWYRGTLDALRLRLRDALHLAPAKCLDLVFSFSSPVAPAALVPMLLYALMFDDIIRPLTLAFILIQIPLAFSASQDLSARDRAKVLAATIPYVFLNSLIALASVLSLLIPVKPKWMRTEKTGKALRNLVEVSSNK